MPWRTPGAGRRSGGGGGECHPGEESELNEFVGNRELSSSLSSASAVAYFGGDGRLSKRSIRRHLADIHGIPISLGGVSKLEARTGLALQSIHTKALDQTLGEDDLESSKFQFFSSPDG